MLSTQKCIIIATKILILFFLHICHQQVVADPNDNQLSSNLTILDQISSGYLPKLLRKQGSSNFYGEMTINGSNLSALQNYESMDVLNLKTDDEHESSDEESSPRKTDGKKFIISSAKPWRKDDSKSKIKNAKAEEAIDTNGVRPRGASNLEMKPLHREFNVMSPDDCGKAKFVAQRVVNGRNAVDGQFPWIALILKNGDPWCGGSIINERYVLTAGHCFMEEQDPSIYTIKVGSINRFHGQIYKISDIIIHERFNLDTMLNSDMTLLKIEKPIKMGHYVNTICLPANVYDEPSTKYVTVAGWGRTDFANPDPPSILQYVYLSRISDYDCAIKFKEKKHIIYKSQICTWMTNKDACSGDSGGPAFEYVYGRAVLIGLVSFGITCADEYPGVYTQISYFLEWIQQNIDL